MNIIDTHCHLDFDVFANDRDEVFTRARESGLVGFVIPAVQFSTWDMLIQLCDGYGDVYYALGKHPIFIEEHESSHLQALQKYLQVHQAIAVGEIGLDFYDRSLVLDKQIEFFESQLEIACNFNLPVILHVRKAHEEVLGCLKKYPVCGGIVHAYNGSLQQAQRYMQHNFKFGFGGMLTYERSTKLRKLAKELPVESIVLETDSPDMTVQSHRGERNSPEYLPDCLQALAEIRDLSLQEVAVQTINTTYDVFSQMSR